VIFIRRRISKKRTFSLSLFGFFPFFVKNIVVRYRGRAYPFVPVPTMSHCVLLEFPIGQCRVRASLLRRYAVLGDYCTLVLLSRTVSVRNGPCRFFIGRRAGGARGTSIEANIMNEKKPGNEHPSLRRLPGYTVVGRAVDIFRTNKKCPRGLAGETRS